MQYYQFESVYKPTSHVQINNIFSQAFFPSQADFAYLHDSQVNMSPNNLICSQDETNTAYNSSEGSEQAHYKGEQNEMSFDLSVEEIETLKEFVLQYKRDWKKIRKAMNKQYSREYSVEHLKEKFNEVNNLKPKLTKFTAEDDLKLKLSVERNGLDWIKISSEFPDRCPFALKNRYYSFIKAKKQGRKALFNKLPEEEKKFYMSDINGSPKEYYDESLKEFTLDTLVKDIEFEALPAWLSTINGFFLTADA